MCSWIVSYVSLCKYVLQFLRRLNVASYLHMYIYIYMMICTNTLCTVHRLQYSKFVGLLNHLVIYVHMFT